MAKKQTRRTFSVSKACHDSVKDAAAKLSMSSSQLVEEALRAYGVQFERGVYLDKTTRTYVRAGGVLVQPVVIVTAATPIPPVPRPTRAAPPLGTSCANCIDAKATHRGRVDVDGPEYWLCSECELPDDRRENRPRKRSAS